MTDPEFIALRLVDFDEMRKKAKAFDQFRAHLERLITAPFEATGTPYTKEQVAEMMRGLRAAHDLVNGCEQAVQ